jgi:putative peptidoglycan binding protein
MKLFFSLVLLAVFVLSPAATAGKKKDSGGGGKAHRNAAGGGQGLGAGGGKGLGGGGGKGQGGAMGRRNFGQQGAHLGKGNALHQGSNLGKHGQISGKGLHQGKAFTAKGNHQLGLHHKALHTHVGVNRLHAVRNIHVRKYSVVVHNYRGVYHERFWWRSHYNRIVLVGGGWYYWDAGYWFPAWGYDPGVAFYAYDGPIYSYDNLPPDQVILNIQSELQFQGYYTGPIDGELGPLTRTAIADYQRDHDLEITSAADEPTVNELGLV